MRYHSTYQKYNVLTQYLEPTIKPLSTYTRGELTIEVLKWIAITGIIGTTIVLPGSAMILKVFEVTKPNEIKRLQSTLYGLERNGYIQRSDQKQYTLTTKGQQKIVSYAIDTIVFTQPTTWDNFWRLILFDIPNTNKKQRDLLSWKLQDAGARRLQKSIFIKTHKNTLGSQAQG